MPSAIDCEVCEARYYDPVTARFLSTDPVGFVESGGDPAYFNRYAYVGNDPVNMLDPDGRAAIGKAIKFGRKVHKYKGDVKRAGKEVLEGIIDNIDTLADGQLNGDDAVAAIDLVTGLDKKDQAGIKSSVKKTYQTYTKRNRKTGEVYSGRTSGTGTPEQNVSNRDSNHHMSDKGFGPARLDNSSTNPDAIRGREQQLIDTNGGAQSQGGTSGNAINGIANSNPNRDQYIKACKDEFCN